MTEKVNWQLWVGVLLLVALWWVVDTADDSGWSKKEMRGTSTRLFPVFFLLGCWAGWKLKLVHPECQGPLGAVWASLRRLLVSEQKDD